jgi:hypothetical protein
VCVFFVFCSVFIVCSRPLSGRATPSVASTNTRWYDMMDTCVAGPSCFLTCPSFKRGRTAGPLAVLLLKLEPLQTHSCLLAGSLPLPNPTSTTSPAVLLQPLAADRVCLVPGQPSGGQGGNGRHHSHDHQHNQPGRRAARGYHRRRDRTSAVADDR